MTNGNLFALYLSAIVITTKGRETPRLSELRAPSNRTNEAISGIKEKH